MDSKTDSKSQTNTCLKGCLVGCLIIVGLGILMGIGCLVCTGSFFGPMMGTIANAAKIQAHFTKLESEGWEVDDSQSNQPEGFGAKVESDQLMTWRARENRDDEWTIYTWEMRLADESAQRNLEEGDLSNWQALRNWALVPRTQAALDVHEELNLPLPDGFELEPLDDEGSSGNRLKDRANEDEEDEAGTDDETDDTDERIEDTDEEQPDDEEPDEDRPQKPRRGDT